MKNKVETIPKKITLLNEVVLKSMTEENDKVIIKNFTDIGIKILKADFGFSWWKFSTDKEYELAYKSPSTPYEPFIPREKASHYTALKTKRPFFDIDVKKENYGSSDISPHMKSYIIIPITYGNYIYGTLALCYKKNHKFTEEEITLAQAIGHNTAQTITIHKLLQTEILLNQEKLKTEFIANATHELRTPLAIMKGNVDLALMSKDDLKLYQNSLKAINQEIDHLADILRDLAMLTSGKNIKHSLSATEIDLVKLIIEIANRLKAVAGKKKINIQVMAKTKTKLAILGDENYLDKLFLNIIKNAITYGKTGGYIKVQVAKEKNTAKITISDNGIGISKEDLPYIFERFYRGDKAHSASGTHSGLGLAIAKWAAEIHGGKIVAQSAHSKGATFTITLPLITT